MKWFMHFILMITLFITKEADTLIFVGDYKCYLQLEWRVWKQTYISFSALLLYNLFV